jgi:type II secretory pathway predicted ATPase ExeA
MYLDYFGLSEDPFRLSPDAEFFFPSLSHQTAKSYMDYVLWSRDSFILITGEIGTGKTTLIQKMLAEAGHKLTVAKIHQTQLNEVEFLQALLDQFGINPFHTTSKVELLSMINRFLKEKYEQGETVVLIIDEAQNLSNRVLEEIRLLSGFDSSREKILNIFLVGQPELKEKLLSPEMEQLFQRIRLRFHIKGLGFDEVRSYIRHRLAVASGVKIRHREGRGKQPLLAYPAKSEPIDLPIFLFSDDLIPLVMRYTGGIPRLINTLCDTALLITYANNKDKPDEEILTLALEDLQWPEYNQRRNYRSDLPGKGAGIAASAPATAGSATLLVTLFDKIVSVEKIEKERVYVGRSHLCDIVINQRSISSKHFRIIRKDKEFFIEDMNSTNGTFLNSKKITGMHKLKDGDQILVGKYKLTFSTKDISQLDPVRNIHLISA